MSTRRLILCGVCLWLALVPRAALAHRLPPEVVAFFQVDGARLHVLVRVPTAILLDAHLPLIDASFLDLSRMDPALRAVSAEVARSLDVTDAGRPLAAGPASWILSPLGDRSFDSYGAAVARLAGPPMANDRAVYWSEAFADFRFEYALSTTTPRIEARVNGLRMGGDFVRTRATYMSPLGGPRTVTAVGPPRRVAFEPPTAQALAVVLRQVADRLMGERLIAFFLLCLAIAARRVDDARPFMAFAILQTLALMVVALSPVPLPDLVGDVARCLAGAAVVLAGVQAFIGSGVTGTTAVAAAFGALSGVVLGSRVWDLLPLAGSHGGSVLAALAVLVLVACAVLLVVLRSLVRLRQRLHAPDWVVLAALCALAAHEATHVVAEAAGRLAGIDPWTLPPAAGRLLAHWPVLALALGLALLWLAALNRRLMPLSSGEGGAP